MFVMSHNMHARYPIRAEEPIASAEAVAMAEIPIGTSSFTAQGWDGIFYPKGLRAADRLSCYATKFDTVKFDTFGVELIHSFACQASRGDWPKPFLPQGMACLRVPSPCGA